MPTDPRRAPRKSSALNSQGNSVLAEASAANEFWQKKTGCTTLIRLASDLPAFRGMALLVTPDEWRAFIAGAKAGEFDLDENDLLPAKVASGS